MQEIIVYRNPVEAAFWQGVKSGTFFPVIVWMFAVVLTFVVVFWLFDKYKRNIRTNKKQVMISNILVFLCFSVPTILVCILL